VDYAQEPDHCEPPQVKHGGMLRERRVSLRRRPRLFWPLRASALTPAGRPGTPPARRLAENCLRRVGGRI